MLNIKCAINQQYLKTVDLQFVKSDFCSLTWSCGSRQRDTTSSGWKFRLDNLAVKGLMKTRIALPHAMCQVNLVTECKQLTITNILWNSIALTSFVFTELGNTIKHGRGSCIALFSSTDVRFWRIKTIPALKGLIHLISILNRYYWEWNAYLNTKVWKCKTQFEMGETCIIYWRYHTSKQTRSINWTLL